MTISLILFVSLRLRTLLPAIAICLRIGEFSVSPMGRGQGEGRINLRTALRKRTALTFPLHRNGSLPLPTGERNKLSRCGISHSPFPAVLRWHRHHAIRDGSGIRGSGAPSARRISVSAALP